MSRIGVLCPDSHGHLNAMLSLSYILHERGHEIHFYGPPDLLPYLKDRPFTPHIFGKTAFPEGHTADLLSRLAQLSPPQIIRTLISAFLTSAQVAFDELTPLLKSSPPNLLLIDQTSFGIPTIADYLSIPYITVANALLLLESPGIPSVISTRMYTGTWYNRLLSDIESYIQKWLFSSLDAAIHEQRRLWNLPPYSNPDDGNSDLAVLAQLLQSLDFPRTLPPHYHYVGKLSDPSGVEPLSKHVSFDWDALNPAKKLVYASLGSIFIGDQGMFDTIAEACAEIDDVQLVVALGDKDATPWEMAGDTIVVPYAPQEQLIARADAVINHGSPNPVNTCLMYGKPMVSIPTSADQPATANRVEFSGVGKCLSKARLSKEAVREAVRCVLGDEKFAERAREMMEEMKGLGVVRGADVVEEVLRTGRAVRREWVKTVDG